MRFGYRQQEGDEGEEEQDADANGTKPSATEREVATSKRPGILKSPPASKAHVSEVNDGKGKANGKGGSKKKNQEEELQVQKEDTKDDHMKAAKDNKDKKRKKHDEKEMHQKENNEDKFDPSSQVALVARALEKTLG